MKGKHDVMKYSRKSKQYVTLGNKILGSLWGKSFVIDYWAISVNVGQTFVSASNFFSRTPEFVFQFQIHHKLIKFGNNMGSSTNKKVI